MKITNLILYTAICIVAVACGKQTQETKPIRQNVIETVFASGILEAEGTYSLTAETDGYLVEVLFEEGDLIVEGQVLAVVNNKQNDWTNKSSSALFEIARQNTENSSPSISQAKNSVYLAKQKLELDSELVAKYEALLSTNSVSKSDYDNSHFQYESSRTNYLNAVQNYNQVKQQTKQSLITSEAQKEISQIVSGNNAIKAVFDGKVYKKYKRKGDYVKKGEIIAAIGDARFIYAKVNIDEGNIEKVHVGQLASIKLNTNNSKIYKGEVSEIYPSFDESTQSFICKIILNEPLLFNIVNTQLQANILVSETKNALLIPRDFIDFGGKVWIKKTNEKVLVNTKFISNEWVQVLSGIDENTVLITDNIKENKTSTSELGGQMH